MSRCWAPIAMTAALVVAVPAMGQQTMRRVVEPNEHAYSLVVPQGWIIQGGIQRRSALQPHSLVSIESPGGTTFLLFGNPQAITYSTPIAGYPIGSLFAGNGDPMIMRPYMPGRQFAVEMGQWLLSKAGCGSVRLLNSQDKPIRSENIAGFPETNTAGEAFFQCERNGIPFDAYMFSRTQMFGRPAGNIPANWNADTSYFFITPHGEGNAAGALLTQMIASVRLNPQWYAAQTRIAGDVAIATANRLDAASAALAQSMQQSFGQTEAERAAAQDEFGRLISGFDEYRDAAGNRHTVPYGQAPHWYTNGLGQVVGRPGGAPGLQWSEMTRVRPGE